jgi:hypothetical protein
MALSMRRLPIFWQDDVRQLLHQTKARALKQSPRDYARG